jgi:hypothetical protein
MAAVSDHIEEKIGRMVLLPAFGPVFGTDRAEIGSMLPQGCHITYPAVPAQGENLW